VSLLQPAAKPVQLVPKVKPVLILGINVDPVTLALFETCFQRVGVPIHVILASDFNEVRSEGFDAYVLKLDLGATAFLTQIRQSEMTPRPLVYGIGTLEDALRCSGLGINVIIEQVTEAAISKAVDATFVLLVRHLRRHVRIPILTNVTASCKSRSYVMHTHDLSAGGMSVWVAQDLPELNTARLSFVLPYAAPFDIDAVVCRRLAHLLGFQFQNSPEQNRLKMWIDDYFGN
jgi:hypothetical protein